MNFPKDFSWLFILFILLNRSHPKNSLDADAAMNFLTTSLIFQNKFSIICMALIPSCLRSRKIFLNKVFVIYCLELSDHLDQ